MTNVHNEPQSVETLRLPGLSCPMPVLRAKKALAKMTPGLCWRFGVPIRTARLTFPISADRPVTVFLSRKKWMMTAVIGS